MQLPELSPASLEGLAAALKEGRLRPPWRVETVRQYVAQSEAEAMVAALERLSVQHFSPNQLGQVLQLVAGERRALQRALDTTELVWSGPELPGSSTRETSVVVRELFSSAQNSVLVASYSVDHGEKTRALFTPLAENMARNPALQVRLFVNIGRDKDARGTDAEMLRRFADRFRQHSWPETRLPQVYYDPRALLPLGGDRSCFHAKCLIIDDTHALITSANFTEAAQIRNFEAGVFLNQSPLARTLRQQFDQLVEHGDLLPLKW